MPVPDEDDEEGEESVEEPPQECTVTPGKDVELRNQKLATLLREEGADLPWQERSQLDSFLLEHHQAFSLEDGEWARPVWCRCKLTQWSYGRPLLG